MREQMQLGARLCLSSPTFFILLSCERSFRLVSGDLRISSTP